MGIGTRIKSVKKPNGKEYRYIQLIETKRTPGGPRQKVIATIGRLDGDGPQKVDRLIKNLSRYARKVKILDLMEDIEPI